VFLAQHPYLDQQHIVLVHFELGIHGMGSDSAAFILSIAIGGFAERNSDVGRLLLPGDGLPIS
jgi:hypothetical protein